MNPCIIPNVATKIKELSATKQVLLKMIIQLFPFLKDPIKQVYANEFVILLQNIINIHKNDILQHPKARYYNLMKSLECDTCVNDELSHYFEKSWEAVFYPLTETKIVPYTNSISTIFTKMTSFYLKMYKNEYELDLGNSPTSGPLFWNTIYIINKLTYTNLYVNN